MKSRANNLRGLSLVEVQVTLVVALVTVLGAIQFRYYSAKAGTRAEVYHVAAQVGNHILKTWRASGQLESFVPDTALGSDNAFFTITPFNSGSGLSVPTGMTLLGHYQVQSGDHYVIVTLAYQATTSSAPALRAVGVGWRNDYQAGALSANDDSLWLSLY